MTWKEFLLRLYVLKNDYKDSFFGYILLLLLINSSGVHISRKGDYSSYSMFWRIICFSISSSEVFVDYILKDCNVWNGLMYNYKLQFWKRLCLVLFLNDKFTHIKNTSLVFIFSSFYEQWRSSIYNIYAGIWTARAVSHRQLYKVCLS